MAIHDTITGNHAPWFNIQCGIAQKILPELSAREAEISILYSSGIDVRSIGHCLCISDSTVNNHLANAKTKLDSNNISELRASILLRILVCQLTNQNNLATDGDRNV
ncbi:helix-turn-helix transcriptional regulator [Citrobacter freundii]|uniref:helix-turn-helix transcriptional regulator n=1 Tax=Citrobacter freundii TaxID=546 RepID=UPI0015EA92BE|nr:LuxR C-terminal-related transcriptional regulator [Citrobacter freundii]QMN60960.1 hypothetical protein HVW68_23190 [Citrobacter freundii]